MKIPRLFPDLDKDSKTTLSIVFCFGMAALFYLSIFDLAGSFGGVVGAFTVMFLGRGAFLLPLSFLIAGMILIRLQKNQELAEDLTGKLIWGLAMMVAAFNGFLSLAFDIQTLEDQVGKAGGVLGYILYPYILGQVFGKFGAALILFLLLAMGFFLISNLTFVQFLGGVKEAIRDPKKVMDLIPDLFEFWKRNGKPQSDTIPDENTKSAKETNAQIAAKEKEFIKKIKEKEKVVDAKVNQPKPEQKKKARFSFTNADDKGVIDMEQTSKPFDWKLPPFDILKENKSEVEPGDIEGNMQVIEETLAHFGIKVEMGEAHVGPTVTQYTFKPANGVRLSSIDKLQKDLALALAAENIRIEAPIAGQSLVGVEIPNKKKSEVTLRDILQTHEFLNYDGDLAVAVGKDVTGRNIISPLSKMPHLLVAGATGAGKSVWINNMLLSLLYRYSPQEFQLILVDMKRVELKLYDGVPHLLTPVITEAEKAINALKWTVIEMDKRYKQLEETGKRNIQDYNKFAEDADVEAMPYIVFVIDELGDLMMLAKSEVEPIIVRLTQMARAVGIHVVLGTQRPDTSVITGLIKANVPTRIAFAVVSQIDSRVILDSKGAEDLLGKGDGMFLSPSSMHAVRFQGPNVEESEVKKCIDYLKAQAKENESAFNTKEEVVETPKIKVNVPGMETSKSTDPDNNEEQDETFEEAKRIVIKYQKASASFLQQIMGIGYPKAARIILRLEDQGVVGPQNGSKPRDVYVTEDDISENLKDLKNTEDVVDEDPK